MPVIELTEIRSRFPEVSAITPLGVSSGQKYVFSGMTGQRKVALKLFKPNTDARRVEREIQAVATLQSNYVPRVFMQGQRVVAGINFFYLVEEFVNGEMLRALLQRQATLALAEVLRLGEVLLRACAEFEQKRIVHRDIKPENLIIDGQGKYWVIDFGICRLLDLESLTASAQRMGLFTAGYAAPEQMRNAKAEIDSRADLYSVGIVLYEALTGSNPYLVGKSNVLEVIRDAGGRDLPRLKNANDPRGTLADFLSSMSSRYASRRPKTAADALEWFLQVRTSLTLGGR